MRLRAAALAAALLVASTLPAQAPAPTRVRHLLDRTVRVEVAEGRFASASVDSLPAGAPGAALVNGHRRLYEYLVQHQAPPARLFVGVVGAGRDPTAAFVANLTADPAAVRTIAAYLDRTGAPPARAAAPRRPVPESAVLAVASRFFHPVVTPERRVQFYRCAGINGVEALGPSRDPAVEAFAFWALAPLVFDADTATAEARGLDADFGRAKAAFRTAVQAAAFDTPAVAPARAALYGQMAGSAALRSALRDRYRQAGGALPFRVAAWDAPPAGPARPAAR